MKRTEGMRGKTHKPGEEDDVDVPGVYSNLLALTPRRKIIPTHNASSGRHHSRSYDRRGNYGACKDRT